MAILEHQGTVSTPRSVPVCYVANEVALAHIFSLRTSLFTLSL